MNKQTSSFSRGFTLIEVLIVIFIVGILTGIAVPQYNRSVRRAKMTEALTHGKTILDSAQRYKSVNSVAPTTFNQLDVSFFGTETEDKNSFNDGNFIYSLTSDRIIAASTDPAEDYRLVFKYPTMTGTGVYSSIACCPADNWLCKNMGVVSTNPDMPENCLEIK